MKKRVVLILLCIALCAALAACGGNEAGKENSQQPQSAEQYSFPAVPLTDEEQELLGLMSADIVTVSDADYVSTVSEILYHGASYAGKVFQLEGTLTVDGEAATLSRNLVSDQETAVLELPLRYLSKEVSSGTWARLTGIVAVTEEGQSVLDVVAIEGLAQQGQANMKWDGGEIHHH